MKMMKLNHIALMWSGAADLAGNQSVLRCRSAVRRLSVCAALMQCLTLTQAADAPPARDPNSPPTQAQQPAYIPEGRQMERYKAFARQAELPPITITNKTMLKVGGVVKGDAARLAQLSIREKEALAEQFGVPVGVINKVVQRGASSSPPGADEIAQELRTAVIDYRFLQREWDRYLPPAEGQKTKAAALEALQAGNISKAWEMYDGLRKPQAPGIVAPAPPANLRIVTQP
jgi:hypothetical protein